MAFVVYYALENCLKVWAMGPARYCWHKTNIFEGVVTFALVVGTKATHRSVHLFFGSDAQTSFTSTLCEGSPKCTRVNDLFYAAFSLHVFTGLFSSTLRIYKLLDK